MVWLWALFFLSVQADCPTSYTYAQAGTDWPGLCATGSNQSPVNLPSKAQASEYFNYIFPNYFPWYNCPATTCTCCSYSIQLNTTGTFIMKENGLSLVYKPNFISIHSPSEHQINDISHDIELQIYHNLFSGQTTHTVAAVSLFFDAAGTTDLPFFAQFVDSVALSLDNIAAVMNLATVISQMTTFQDYYYYEGSMTTPPCTENVNWILIPEAVTISEAQLAVFTNIWSGGGFKQGNSRALQKLNGRSVYYKAAVEP
jgi:carbonic anhydrase